MLLSKVTKANAVDPDNTAGMLNAHPPGTSFKADVPVRFQRELAEGDYPAGITRYDGDRELKAASNVLTCGVPAAVDCTYMRYWLPVSVPTYMGYWLPAAVHIWGTGCRPLYLHRVLAAGVYTYMGYWLPSFVPTYMGYWLPASVLTWGTGCRLLYLHGVLAAGIRTEQLTESSDAGQTSDDLVPLNLVP